VDAVILSRALDDLLKHHDVLRSRFRRVAGEWSEHVPETAPSVPVVISTDDQTEAIAAAQHLIDLESGRLMAAALINGSDGRPAQLLLVIHHLVVDGVSIRVLLEDLESAYRGRVEGVALILPPRTTSFRRWAHSLLTFARTAQVQRQIDYWRSVPDEAAATIPTGLVMRNDNIPAPASLTLELPADLTERLVRDLPRTRGVSAQHLFLAAFLLTWQRLTGCLELQLDLEGHGREPIDDVSDVSRTVGWFTTIYPVRFALSADPGIILDGVRRRLDEVPDHGIGYGLLRYLSNDSCLADLPQSAIAFNYLGRFERSSADDRVFGIPLEAPKILHSDHVVGRYALELIVTVVADRLLLEVRYRRDKFDETTIRSLLYGNAAALRELVDVLSGAIRATGDFPLAKLTPGQLDLVRQQVGDGR
jgi:non-ribosomal peptide synthase protein (TIGR01720 family)